MIQFIKKITTTWRQKQQNLHSIHDDDDDDFGGGAKWYSERGKYTSTHIYTFAG